MPLLKGPDEPRCHGHLMCHSDTLHDVNKDACMLTHLICPIYLCFCLFVYLSIYLSIDLSIHLSMDMCHVYVYISDLLGSRGTFWAVGISLSSTEVEQSSTSSNFMEDLESMTCFNQACSACDTWTWNASLVDLIFRSLYVCMHRI